MTAMFERIRSGAISDVVVDDPAPLLVPRASAVRPR
jgi:hypothetical protein